MNAQLKGAIRHALTFGGGYAVAKGWLDEGLMLELVGASMTLIGGVWSIFAKEKKG